LHLVACWCGAVQGTTLNMGVAGLDPALVRDFAITGARFILQGAQLPSLEDFNG
jgi:hypothetical protein